MLEWDELFDILDYNSESGIFTWKINRGSAHIGDIAGCLDRGYIKIRINGNAYKAHRLAWFYEYGKWPVDDIDHINRNRSDNSITNLRECTRSENMCNIIGYRSQNNTSKYKGVYFEKSRNKWCAKIEFNGKRKFLGRFNSEIEAHEAYNEEAKKFHGDFVNIVD